MNRESASDGKKESNAGGQDNAAFTIDDEPPGRESTATTAPNRESTATTASAKPSTAADGKINPAFVAEEPFLTQIITGDAKPYFSDVDIPGNDESIRSRSVKFSTVSEPGISSSTRGESTISAIAKGSILEPIRRFQSYVRPSAAQKSPKKKCGSVLHNYLGIILTLLTSLVMSLGSFFVSLLQKGQGGYSPFLTTFWRFLGVFVPAVPTLIYYKYFTNKFVLDSVYPCTEKSRWKTILLVVTRGVLGTTGFIFQYFALQYITLGDTSVISFSSPIFVIMFGRCCLKEECGFFNTGVAFLTIVGVLITAKPPFIFGGEKIDEEAMLGIGLAIGCCLSNTLVYICLRFLKDVHFSVISIMFGAIGLAITTVAALIVEGFKWPLNLEHWFLFIGVATLGFLGQVGLTFALKYEQAGIVSAFRTSDIVFSFIWQSINGNDGKPISVTSIAGAIIVIVAVSSLAFRKWLADKPPEHKCRQRLWFVLK